MARRADRDRAVPRDACICASRYRQPVRGHGGSGRQRRSGCEAVHAGAAPRPVPGIYQRERNAIPGGCDRYLRCIVRPDRVRVHPLKRKTGFLPCASGETSAVVYSEVCFGTSDLPGALCDLFRACGRCGRSKRDPERRGGSRVSRGNAGRDPGIPAHIPYVYPGGVADRTDSDRAPGVPGDRGISGGRLLYVSCAAGDVL